MLRRTNKNKKYALRKVGKYFGSCVIGTMIAIGVATTIPSNEVHAAQSEFVPYKVYDVTITPDQPETVYKADDTRDVGYRHEEKGTPGKQEIWTKYESRYYFMDEYDAYKNIKGNVEMLDDLYLSNKYKTLDEEGNIPAHPNWKDDYVNNNGEEFPKRIDENGDGEFTDVSKPDPVTHEVKPIEHKVESNKKFVALPDTVTPDNSDQSSVLMDDHGYGYSGKEEVVADYDSDNKVVRLNPHYYEIRDIPKVDTVITLGTKPKVVEEEIPVTTTYTDDPTLEKGKEVVVTEGEAGSKETVTRYTVNKDTGEITETTSVRTTKKMVPRVVKRGTKEVGNLPPINLIPEKPSETGNPVIRTVWRDENGKDLKTPSVEKQEAGEVEGYEFVESHREGDNLTVHVFRTKQAQTPAPKDQTPSPAPSKVSEQKGEAVATATSEKTVDSATSTKTSDKAELPNTGTETNATLASAGIMTLLAGLVFIFFKKKEDKN